MLQPPVWGNLFRLSRSPVIHFTRPGISLSRQYLKRWRAINRKYRARCINMYVRASTAWGQAWIFHHDGEQPDENVCQDPANLAFRDRDAPAVFRLALTYCVRESSLTVCATFRLLAGKLRTTKIAYAMSKYIFARGRNILCWAGHDFINALRKSSRDSQLLDISFPGVILKTSKRLLKCTNQCFRSKFHWKFIF